MVKSQVIDQALYDRLFGLNQTTSEWFWLPPGLTWEGLNEYPNAAHLHDLIYVIPGCILVLLLRIKKPKKLYKDNKLFEKEYINSKELKEKKLSGLKLVALCKASGKSEYEVQNWMRKRHKADITPTITKFAESGFRFIFYLFSFAWGMCVLVNRPWFWDITDCWKGLGKVDIDSGTRLYYYIQLSYYVGCLITLPFDNKRKDFIELVIHHFATVALIFFSYITNFWKVGTLVMAVHDCSDIVLDLAKAFNYAKYDAVADNLFVGFAITFFVSRIIVFPFHILYSVMFDTYQEMVGLTLWDYLASDVPWIPTLMAFSALLFTLLILHIFWFSIIVRMAISMLGKGTVEGDARSDSESADDDVEEEKTSSKNDDDSEEEITSTKGTPQPNALHDIDDHNVEDDDEGVVISENIKKKLRKR
eukprot:Pgem_evm1s9299